MPRFDQDVVEGVEWPRVEHIESPLASMEIGMLFPNRSDLDLETLEPESN